MTSFQVPNAAQRTEAVGKDLIHSQKDIYKNTEHVKSLESYLDLCNNEGLFPPKIPPVEGDWLFAQEEKGQPVSDYLRDHKSVDEGPQYVDIVPIGEFKKNESPPFSFLQAYAAAYLCVPVRILPEIELGPAKSHHILVKSSDKKKPQEIEFRLHPFTRKRQLLAGDIQKILRDLKREDTICVLGLTMEDLYPKESWNFVFGQANRKYKTGIFSFARLHPYFNELEDDGLLIEEPESWGLLLRRSCQVMVHEIIHMFGIRHCIYYECCLNGSNCLEESDRAPLELCPVCLHKMYLAHRELGLSFDAIERQNRLKKIYEEQLGFRAEHEWSKKLLELVENKNQDHNTTLQQDCLPTAPTQEKKKSKNKKKKSRR